MKCEQVEMLTRPCEHLIFMFDGQTFHVVTTQLQNFNMRLCLNLKLLQAFKMSEQ